MSGAFRECDRCGNINAEADLKQCLECGKHLCPACWDPADLAPCCPRCPSTSHTTERCGPSVVPVPSIKDKPKVSVKHRAAAIVGCGIPYCCAMMLIYSTSNPTEGTMESCPQCHRVWRFEDGRWAKATVELPVVGVVQPSPPARSPYDYGCCATEIGKVSDDERVRGKLVECPTCKCAWSYRSPDWELVVCPANKMNEELR